MPEPAISLTSRVVASQQQVSTELGREAVILGAKLGEYFGLNEVGARVWALLQRPIEVARLCQTIENEYEVSTEQCQRDVLELLHELQQKGLVEVTPGSAR